MTVEERVTKLMNNLPYRRKTVDGVKGFEALLTLSIKEAMRDQRHACAEALPLSTFAANEAGVPQYRDEAHQAVMNAEVK